MEWILLILIPIGLTAIFAAGAGSQLHSIKQKFATLGTIAGRSKADIIAAVGPPNSVSGMAEGKTLLQWQHTSQAGAYHIALLFDAEDICEGVTHEYAS
jgi:hypothetical protein